MVENKGWANLRPRKPGDPALNPGGRPKIPAEVKELAKAASPRAIQRQIELMESRDENVALKATEAVLNRAYGKPAQVVDVKSSKRDLLEYSIADLVAIAYQRGMQEGAIEGEVMGSTDDLSAMPAEKPKEDQ